MMRKRELLRMLDERDAQICKLNQYAGTQDRLIEGYQSREKSIVDALARAQEAAERILSEAQRQAAEIRAEAEQAASERLAQAEETYRRTVEDAENAVSEYEEAIRQYNAALESAAQEAAANAERFASFARGKRLSAEEIAGDESFRCAPQTETDDLPDVENNPAQLMQNIYRIQRREIPDEARERPAPQPWRPDGDEDPATDETLADVGAEIEEALAAEDALPGEEAEAPMQTVSAVLSETETAHTEDGQDVSLDALLDEIIQSGEQNNGEQ